MSESELLTRLAKAAAAHAPFDGWSGKAFRAAAADCGIPEAEALLAAPRGAIDLAAAFHRAADAEMRRRLGGADLTRLKFRERVAWAVRLRLEIVERDKEAVRRAAALYALPTHAAEGAKLVWETCDAIWTALGDASRDYNWHTKRWTLMGVYGATLLVWLNDSSEENAETWAFLDRRIEEVMTIERVKAAARKNSAARILLTGPRLALSFLKAPTPRSAPPAGNWPGREAEERSGL